MAIVSYGKDLGWLPAKGDKGLGCLMVRIPFMEVVGNPSLFADSCLLHLVGGNRWIVVPKRCSTMPLFASASLLFMDAPDVFIAL